MSIQSEITRISGNVSDALGAVAAKGVTVPAGANSDDLADLIAQISTGGGSAIVVTETQDVSGGVIKNIQAVDLGNDTVDAAHLLQGYTAHDHLGNAITGTYAGGGASNFVTGTFTTGSGTGVVETVNIPYSGSGYPLLIDIVIENGAYNNTSTGDTDWYSSTQRYIIGQWTCTKSNFTTAPTYGTSGSQNQGVTTSIYKNSTSSATSYNRTSAMTSNVFSSGDPGSSSPLNSVKYKSGNKLAYYIATTTYGLKPSTEYRYFIVFSE